MASPTAICNLALSHLGVSVQIANIETEKSKEASACRAFYDTVRDQVLRDFPWPFATRTADLALVATVPTTEWGYAYRYPADCLAFRRIVSGAGRRASRRGRVAFRFASDDAGQLIYTDWPNAVGEWTTRIEDPARYPPDCVMAMSLLLAATIAPRVTAGDQFKLGARAFQLYQLQIASAHANAANEEQPDPPPESEFIEARD